MNPLKELAKCGQSVWLDNINREILENGKMKEFVKDYGVTGVTSNPAIFQKAMGSGNYYDKQIKSVINENPLITTADLFEELAIKDIQKTADTLFSIYKSTDGTDGFVSLEVSPELAYDTSGTIKDARRLFKKAARPNVMIKIPATAEGIPAIKQMISEGVNINVTLIFSQKVYEQVVEAYLSGLEKRLQEGNEINNIASVASFFISRIDSAVDKELEKSNNSELPGRIAIANAKMVYQQAKVIFGSSRFKKLNEKGALLQRLLWASTGTKNPSYKDTIYVDELIGENTVNTMPPATMEAFKNHGKAEKKIEEGLVRAQSDMNTLKEMGISFPDITEKLTSDGVTLFLDAYKDLIKTLRAKRNKMLKEIECDTKYFLPEEISIAVNNRMKEWTDQDFSTRFWNKDYSLWKQDKKDNVELSNRLGWLRLPEVMKDEITSLAEFSEEIKNSFENVFILGMGGSSLAPEVFYNVFGRREGYPQLKVVDSTHPAAIEEILKIYKLDKSLFVVASKSGGTTETMSFFYVFYDALSKLKNNPGENFIAVTDAGSSLEKLARDRKFRKIFNTPEEVGGRYSALTFFGLVPAALIGVDIKKLLDRAEQMMNASGEIVKPLKNPGFITGAVIGELALHGRDKLTFLASPSLSSFPVWIEQLIAESTGKEGKGILPVVNELPGIIEVYGKDRSFVYLRKKDDDNKLLDYLTDELVCCGYPVIRIDLTDNYDIGKEFYRWEIATAAAGAVLKINPFDQPNVQLAKSLASEAMKKYSETGKLPEIKIQFSEDGISVAGKSNAKNIKELLPEFLGGASNISYAAIMAFVPPSAVIDNVIEEFRLSIRDKYKIAVTTGYGPRFLHSTGQLHKGDGNNGLFIQIVPEIKNDLKVPETNYSFGTLITAQAQGDYQALENNGRKVLKFIIKGDIAGNIGKIYSSK